MDSVRLFLPAAALAMLLVPGTAGAHGSIQPTAAGAGAVQRFVVTIPNTPQGGPEIVGLTIAAPEAATLESAAASPPGWSAEVGARTIEWHGRPLAGLSAEFAFIARTPSSEGTYAFVGWELYRGGAGVRFPLAVTVTRTDEASDTRAGRLRVVVAVGGAALLLAVGATVLRRRLRQAEPAPDA
jgi:uncharacterized protein YcnI